MIDRRWLERFFRRAIKGKPSPAKQEEGAKPMISLLEVRNIRTMLPQLITFYRQWSLAVIVPEGDTQTRGQGDGGKEIAGVAQSPRRPVPASHSYSPLGRDVQALMARAAASANGPRTVAEKDAAGRMARALRACWYLAEQELYSRGLGKSEVMQNVDRDLQATGEQIPHAPQWEIDDMRKIIRWMMRWYGALGETLCQTDPERQHAVVMIRLMLARALELAELEIRRQALAELAITGECK